MKLDHAIDTAIEAEQSLAATLQKLAGRHAAEHDIYQLGHVQAQKAAARARRLSDFAERYGASPPKDGEPEPGLVDAVRRQTSDLLGRSRSTGLLLLSDLQDAYLDAQRAEIAWTVLLQGARACRDLELVETVTSVHEECEVAAKWLRTRVKVAAPQVLATG
jgi:hypothetical protein